MAQVTETKKGDLLPIWIYQLRRKDPITDKWVNDDLSDVTAVKVYMVDIETGTIIINGKDGAVYDESNALLSYSPASGDTDNVSTHKLEFELTRTDGKVMTVPKKEYDPAYVIITDNVKAA